MLWLWRRLAAEVLIQPLAWELPCAAGAAINRKKKKNTNHVWVKHSLVRDSEKVASEGVKCGQRVNVKRLKGLGWAQLP